MKSIWYLIVLFLFTSVSLYGQDNSRISELKIPFESDANRSATYFEVIDMYSELSIMSPFVNLVEIGFSDAGYPIHEVIFSSDGTFTAEEARDRKKKVLYINNGIHAGEPCGVDASMIFFRDLVSDPTEHESMGELVIVAIPFYNIGGALNRNTYSRANQVGPAEHGFRGNARNLDLNRDFIKCDSKNAMTLNQSISRWRPDIFLDTHTTNGADYPYPMTLLVSQVSKMSGELGSLTNTELLPFIFEDMAEQGIEICPFTFSDPRENGIMGFYDSPRYSSGYATLHHSIAFISEAHMLKTFKERVEASLALIRTMCNVLLQKGDTIQRLRNNAKETVITQSVFHLDWRIDKSRADSFSFNGYFQHNKKSDLTGNDRLYYNKKESYSKTVPYYNHFVPTKSVEKPKAYIIPQAYDDIVRRLNWNGVNMRQLKQDTTIDVTWYSISDFKTNGAVYESHFPHRGVKIEKHSQQQFIRSGAWIVEANQVTNRYIIETLEPEGKDSFFSWNFFDGILQRKEYFSAYLFEDTAVEILSDNPKLKAEFDEKMKNEEEFAQNSRSQLHFIYSNSEYSEKSFLRYPVLRID